MINKALIQAVEPTLSSHYKSLMWLQTEFKLKDVLEETAWGVSQQIENSIELRNAERSIPTPGRAITTWAYKLRDRSQRNE